MITPFAQFRTKEDVSTLLDDDNKLVLPICHNLILLFNKMLDPDKESYFLVEKEDAPILGLFHKQFRYFKYFVDAYESKNVDICVLLTRIIYEAYVKMRYLIDHPNDISEYRALAFKPHVNILNNENLANFPQSSVLKKKFEDAMLAEGFSEDDIISARKYPGGKNFRQMQELYEPGMYNPVYSMTSDSIHSGWNEIRQLYLRYDDTRKQYFVDVDFSQVLHYRQLICMADILIQASLEYFNWIDNKYKGYIPNLTAIIKEHHRVCRLIYEVIMDTYQNNQEEYYYK